MIQCTITINGKYYCGEDIENSYRPGHGTKSNSWSCYAGDEKDMPLIGGESPKIIEGTRCLQNSIENIVGWISDGIIEAGEIKIDFASREG